MRAIYYGVSLMVVLSFIGCADSMPTTPVVKETKRTANEVSQPTTTVKLYDPFVFANGTTLKVNDQAAYFAGTEGQDTLFYFQHEFANNRGEGGKFSIMKMNAVKDKNGMYRLGTYQLRMVSMAKEECSYLPILPPEGKKK